MGICEGIYKTKTPDIRRGKMGIDESLERLSEFLPKDKKLDIFNLVLASYKNDGNLAKNLGCNSKIIRIWSKKGPSSRYMPKILGLALQQCPDTKDVLNETVGEITSLYNSLDTKDTENKLQLFMDALDEKSRQIIWHLLRNGHASIREFAELIDADLDNEILVRIRKVINQKSKKILGKEIMKFENKKIDPLTGKEIPFSWWLTEDVLSTERTNEMIDVFNEKNMARVIAELPSVKEEDIRIKLEDSMLTISTNDYKKNIPLYLPIKKIVGKTYRNNILEVRLEKNGEKEK